MTTPREAGDGTPAPDHALATSSGSATGLRWEIRNRPSYASLVVELGGGEIVAEAGAMVSMSGSGIETAARVVGGLGALVRKVFGGESFFMTSFEGSGELRLAPTLVGDIEHFYLSGNEIFSEPGAFLAATPGVKTSTSFAGLRGLLGGEGAFFLRHDGVGDLFLNGYGAILEVAVEGSYVVDTGHLVAWDGSLDFRVKGAGGLKSVLFSGEGLVVELTGRGKVWIQTRTLDSFAGTLVPYLR